MSEFRIDQIKSQDATRGPDVAGITTFTGVSGIVMPSGDTAYRGGRGRGVFGGGLTHPGDAVLLTMEYVTIATTGNTIDFGDLSGTNRGWISACASSTRGVWAGGSNNAGDSVENTIDYVTISSTGNALDFGDLIRSESGDNYGGFALASCSDATRGIWGGGYSGAAGSGNAFNIKTIQYITFASRGNSSDFGLLTLARRGAGACASTTRGVFAGGVDPAATNVMDYIVFASTGDAKDFGDLITATRRDGNTSCSSSVRGLWGGQTPASNLIEFVTIASTGNAQDFGDLSASQSAGGACSSQLRGLFGGGDRSTIDFVTIATKGNASAFGDLEQAKTGNGGCSDSHGGLG